MVELGQPSKMRMNSLVNFIPTFHSHSYETQDTTFNNNNIIKSHLNSTHVKNLIINKNRYSTTPEGNKTQNSHQSKINIIHWNCNFLKNKLPDILNYIEIESPDVICLNEIKCESSEEVNHLLRSLKEYSNISRVRTKSGGGVLILYKNKLQTMEIDTKKIDDEIVGINIKNKSSELNIFAIYNPPMSSQNKKKLNTELIKNLIDRYKNSLIIGDLNAIMNNNPNTNGKLLLDLIDNSDICIANSEDKFTFTNGEYKSKIDYVLCNIETMNIVEESETIDDHILCSNHLAIRTKIAFEVKIESSSKMVGKFNYSRTLWPTFKIATIIKEYSDEEMKNLRTEDLQEIFLEKMTEATNKTVPRIMIGTDNNDKITQLPKKLLELKKIKNRCQRNRHRSEEAKKEFYAARDLFAAELEKYHSEKWQKFIEKVNPVSSKPFWQRIKSTKTGKKTSNIPSLRNSNGILIDNIEGKIELFTEKLRKTFSESQEETSRFNQKHKEEIDKFVQEKRYAAGNGKSFKKFTMNEINYAIEKLNTKTSVDNTGISNMMIKNTSQSLRTIMLAIFNKCMEMKKIPSCYKEAVVTMLHKKDDPSEIKNYRPISVTPAIMRLFERLISIRLWSFLRTKKIIIKNQSGFRAGRQTKDNLFCLTEKAIEGFNDSKKACTIFYDIAGAFDKVWHNGVVYKMFKIGVPAYIIEFIHEFLSDRTFMVKMENIIGSKTDIHCGVPQGGVLSPTLFSIYINDIPLANKIDSNSSSYLFADDLADVFMFKTIGPRIEDKINKRLTELHEWLSIWRLTLAATKCNYMILSKNKKTGAKDELKLKIGGEFIPKDEDNNIRFLGIRFDFLLSFKHQINYLKDTIRKRMNILKIISHKSWHLNQKTLVNIYKTMIRSVLDYSLFLFPVFSYSNRETLQRLQNNCLRIIVKKNKMEMNVQELHDLCEINFLKERAKNLRLIYIYRALYSNNQLIKELYDGYVDFSKYEHKNMFPSLFDDVSWTEPENSIDVSIYSEAVSET